MLKNETGAFPGGRFKNAKKMVSGLPQRGTLQVLKKCFKNGLKMVAGKTGDHSNTICL